jgi:tetratricopeptide (TPR) repeat protein
MFFSFSTTPVENGQVAKRPQIGSSGRGPVLIILWFMIIWLFLMFVGTMSAVKPDWLERFSKLGVESEARAYKNYGDAALHDGQYAKAVAQYEKSLRIKPAQDGVIINLAIAYRQAGAIEKATKILQDASALGTTRKGLIYYNMAEIQESMGKTHQAITLYKKALGTIVEQDLVYRSLGRMYLGMQDYENALMAFESTLVYQTNTDAPYLDMLHRSLDVYRDDSVHLPIIEDQLARGVGIEDMGIYDTEIIRQLHKTDPEIAKTHNHLGYILFELGDTDAAEKHFEKSLEIWPNNIDATRNLEVIRQMRKSQ